MIMLLERKSEEWTIKYVDVSDLTREVAGEWPMT